MKRTLKDNARLHLLINKRGLSREDKQDLVYWASGGRVTSSADLTHSECQKAIRRLDIDKRQDSRYSPENTMRRKILHYFHEMDYELPNGKIDIDRVNNWCVNRGMFHKPLNDHNYAELVKLVSQVELMYKTKV